MARTITVRGIKIRTAAQRRFAVVAVRPMDIPHENGTLVAFARIIKRSDNIVTARNIARRGASGIGVAAVVVDTTTGEEV